MYRILLGLSVLSLFACIDRRHDDYQYGEALPQEELQSFVPSVVEGLNKLGAGDFKVVRADPTEAFELGIMDGFLYPRNLEVVHLEVELELLRDLNPPMMGRVLGGIGKEGWSMSESVRNRQLALLFGDAANSRNRPEQKNEFQEDLGKAAVQLFGKVGSIASHGSPSMSLSDGAPWRVIIRFGFPAARNHLFSLFPQPEGHDAWASVGGFALQYWREDEGKFSSKPYEHYAAEGGSVPPELAKLKANFIASLSSEDPDGPGARFRSLLKKYLSSSDGKTIEAGQRWITVATAVFNQTDRGRFLQHVGGYWKLHLPREGEGAQ